MFFWTSICFRRYYDRSFKDLS